MKVSARRKLWVPDGAIGRHQINRQIAVLPILRSSNVTAGTILCAASRALFFLASVGVSICRYANLCS